MTGVRESDALWGSDRVEELKEGDGVVTPGGDVSALPAPPWLDKEKFYRARDVYRKYFACVNFSHLCGLLLSFYFTKNIKTLKSTGESSSTGNLFHRYLATIRHVQKWYEGDLWDPADPAHKSLASVRAMHARVASRMAARVDDGLVYVSQWDMALTQWAFVGPLVLFPARVGLHGCSPEDYDALMHFWRGVGHLLGVEDRYNLCQGDYPQALAACNSILDQEYRKRVSEAAPASVDMAQNVVVALHKIDPVLTWGSLATYIHHLVDLPCPVATGFWDWLNFSLLKFVIQWMVRCAPGRALLNDIFRWRLARAERAAPAYGLGWAKRLLAEYAIYDW